MESSIIRCTGYTVEGGVQRTLSIAEACWFTKKGGRRSNYLADKIDIFEVDGDFAPPIRQFCITTDNT